MTKPTSPLQSCLYVPDFDTLAPAPELSLVNPKNNLSRNMTTQLYRERQLWSGNESVEIRYVKAALKWGRRFRHLAFLVICVIRHSERHESIIMQNESLGIWASNSIVFHDMKVLLLKNTGYRIGRYLVLKKLQHKRLNTQ